MPKNKGQTLPPIENGKVAGRREIAGQARAQLPAVDIDELSVQDLRSLVHELQSQNAELEFQNAGLQEQFRLKRDKYTDLYRFAPVAYLILDENDVIVDLNVAAAELLEHEPQALTGQPITPHLFPESVDIYRTCCTKARTSRIPQSCELTVRRQFSSSAYVQMIATVIEGETENGPHWHAVLTDITDAKRVDKLTSTQRDLARLMDAWTTDAHIWALCLQAALDVSELDSGGLYFFNEDSNSFELIHHIGLGEEFTNSVLRYPADTPMAFMIKLIQTPLSWILCA
jgi:PAS domain S-box-containing protein